MCTSGRSRRRLKFFRRNVPFGSISSLRIFTAKETEKLESTAMGATVLLLFLNQQILVHCGFCQAVDNVIHIFRTSCVKTV